MKKRILIVDDFDEIRELVAFMINCNMECEILQISSGNKAIAHLKNDSKFDVIISDLNMPDGNGIDLLNYIKKQNLSIPLAFLTGEDVEEVPALRGALGPRLGVIPKPFTDEIVMSTIQKLLALTKPEKASTAPQKANETAETEPAPTAPPYIAVRLQLLFHVRQINTPLFVKINDQKYVRLTHDESIFTEEIMRKYEKKNITHLYVESLMAQEFIAEYKKRAMSDLAWSEIGDKGSQLIKLNTELLRDLSTKLGWNDGLISLAADNITRALRIASTHPKISHVLNQFHKIEHYGFADHSSLMVMITSGLAFQLDIADPQTLRKLTFASLIHDMQLNDEEFTNQGKIIKLIVSGKAVISRDVKSILSHPTRSAELCRQWDFCPGVVDTIVFQHHEMADGRGFPMGRTADELHPLSCLFIVAEDFANYFVESIGEPDLNKFLQSRKSIYNTGESKKVLQALADSLKSALQTAS